MATKIKKSAEQLRQEALAMLRKAKAQQLEEKREVFFKIGTVVTRYIEGEITAKEMKEEVKTLTGKDYPSERTNTFNNPPTA